MLAPESTPIEDAATRAERVQDKALEQIESLKGMGIGALAQPRLRRDTVLATVALAKRNR